MKNDADDMRPEYDLGRALAIRVDRLEPAVRFQLAGVADESRIRRRGVPPRRIDQSYFAVGLWTVGLWNSCT